MTVRTYRLQLSVVSGLPWMYDFTASSDQEAVEFGLRNVPETFQQFHGIINVNLWAMENPPREVTCFSGERHVKVTHRVPKRR